MKKTLILAAVAVLLVVATCFATYQVMINTASYNMTDSRVTVRIGGQCETFDKSECAHTVQCCKCGEYFTIPFEPANYDHCYCADCMDED